MARVDKGTKAYFINRYGRKIFDAPSGFQKPFSGGRTFVGDTQKGYYYIDTTGAQAFPGHFALASRFHHGLAHVKLWSGKFAYIDPAGRQVFEYWETDPPPATKSVSCRTAICAAWQR